MAERQSGKSSFSRRTHGSERRGVFPVPNLNFASRQEQSQRDRAKVLDKLRQQFDTRVETSDLGNKELPAYNHKQEIIANLEAYKAIILGGPTGSGKSTQVPQFLYEAGYDKTYVLVPRRVIADGLAERLREEFKEQLPDADVDQLVGIAHGERSELSEENRIIVMTPNSFNKAEPQIREKFSEDKVAIISDEIHEANLYTEIATGVAAIGVRDNENWRLIAASATHNAATLQTSFQELNGGFTPTINIEGRPFSVSFEEAPLLNSMQTYVQRGEEHEKSMIFTSGKHEINHIIAETIAELDKAVPDSSKKVVFRKLHGDLSEVELSHIDDPVPEGHRLVVVSSPAGMSGITIPGMTLVISDGTINRQELDDDGIPGLIRRYLSKAEIMQQIGRAGRDVPGGIGILSAPTSVMDDAIRRQGRHVENPDMPFKNYEDREEHAPPEIYDSILSSVVLTVAAVDQRFSDINPYIPHSVKPSAIINAEESLSRIGALDEHDKITPTGRVMNTFPLTPELARGLYEVTRRGRTLQQIARAALIVSAVDAGGLQNFTDTRSSNWKRFIRPTTTDDFMAQLDIMLALREAKEAEEPYHEFIELYDLHPKQTERALNAASKILRILKIYPQNMVDNITHPLPDEEAELRRDLTAGMIDLVYQEAGKSFRKTLYRNIHGDDASTQRQISGRSVSKPRHGQLVAGIPRWYEKKRRGKEPQRFDIIEMTLDVDANTVGEYAAANGLLSGKLISPHVEGDRIVEREQMMFGTIPVGHPVSSTWREHVPESSQALLVQRSLEMPGDAQKALRDIAEELEFYAQRHTAETLAVYRAANAPEDITKPFIEQFIAENAQLTRSLSELDARVGQYIYSKNVTINRYFDDVARRELRSRSPDTIVIGSNEVRVHYEAGLPYITDAKRLEIPATGKIFLSDGREVLAQVEGPSGSMVRVSFDSL